MENKIRNDYKIKFSSHIAIGMIFLLLGIAQTLSIINISNNFKVFFAMAFLAFAISISPLYNYYLLKKHPEAMKTQIIAQSDERTLTIKNETYAETFLILKWIIYYMFFAYTWVFPKEVFNSFGWWCIAILCVGSAFLSISVYFFTNKKY